MKNKNIKFIKGFTLLELLVVVLIIGILAAIALPQYKKAVEKARMTEAIIMVEKIAEAQERYYLVHDDYTRDINDLDLDIPGENIKYCGVIPGKLGKYFLSTASNCVGNQNSIALVSRIPQATKYTLAISKNGKRSRSKYTNITNYEEELCLNWVKGLN